MSTKVVSVRNVGARKGYPYVAAGIYEATPRAKDGVLTYRLVGEASRPCRSVRLATDLARLYAEAHNIPIEYGVRHGNRVA